MGLPVCDDPGNQLCKAADRFFLRRALCQMSGGSCHVGDGALNVYPPSHRDDVTPSLVCWVIASSPSCVVVVREATAIILSILYAPGLPVQ